MTLFHRQIRFRAAAAVVLLLQVRLCADDLPAPVRSLIRSSCMDCHDENTETRLNFETLNHDFANPEAFRQWVGVFDRVRLGEMPPASESQPDPVAKKAALDALRQVLHQASSAAQHRTGRVPSRRLTRGEYEHTLRDLLGIGGDIAKQLPPETESGAFDVVAATQEMSSVHVRGFLRAADLALDEAIQLVPRPRMQPRALDYLHSRYIRMWVDRPIRRGGGTVFRTDEDVISFRGENYVFRSDHNGWRPSVAGRYRISVKAAAYQQRSQITLSLKRQNDTQGESELFAAWDLNGPDYRDVSTVKYLKPGDYIYVSGDELDPAPNGRVIYNSQPASEYKGEGVRIRQVLIEGPLESTWPPERTRRLFPGVEWKRLSTHYYSPVLTREPIDHIRDAVSALATRAFRRPVSDAEIEALVSLAKPPLAAGRGFLASARVPLRAILVSPELLFLTNRTGEEHGLDQYALASRLSYFLWRSLPDEELLRLAETGQLTQAEVLAGQVDRLLRDSRSARFIEAFLGQWLDLDRIDATTPDQYLYPEYDDVLRRAMLAETREFFAHLVDENLSVENLIDSDFTFLNRKLAEHYGIDGVVGEEMRKVRLDAGSLRGGVLAHASIAKVTANGTVTTPVKRGSFVLTTLLGLPPNPPPPGVGAIEPDTRGATTIRETLQKHQAVTACAVCHRKIDPPGFAMECFDPVGNHRSRYRNSKGVQRTSPPGLRFLHKDYTLGQPVDASGTTDDGVQFADFSEFKQSLRGSREQIARNVVSRLVAFSTGAEVQFADRAEVERILRTTKKDGYPMRSLIHHIVASRMFRNR